MSEEIAKQILKNIIFIPGIVGLAKMDFSKNNNSLKEELWEESLELKETKSGFDLSIAVIVEKDINAKMVANEIETSIKMSFKNNNLKLSNLNIFIRGVK